MNRARIFPYIVILAVCNLADWALTMDALSAGWARELNPVGRLMLAQGVAWSLAWKMGIVLAGGTLLYALGTRRWVYVATCGVAWVYVLLIVWHVIGRVSVFG